MHTLTSRSHSGQTPFRTMLVFLLAFVSLLAFTPTVHAEKLWIKAGSTSVRVKLFFQDSSSTTGAGLTGLAYNTSGLTCYYIRDGDSSATQVTLATATLGTWTTGGFVKVSDTTMPGMVEFDIPNAALASGANFVDIFFAGATNMVPCPVEIMLTGPDPADATRFGLASLPNASASSAGGLLTVGTGTGQLNPSAGNLPQITVVASGTAQSGTSSTITLAVGSSSTTDLFKGDYVAIVGGAGAGQARTISGYNGTTLTATVGRNWIVTPDATSQYVVVAAPHPTLDNNLAVTAGTVSGNVTVGGYAGGQDPASLVWGASATGWTTYGTMGFNLLASSSNVVGVFDYNPTTKVLTLKDKSATYTIGTLTLTKDASGNTTHRASN